MKAIKHWSSGCCERLKSGPLKNLIYPKNTHTKWTSPNPKMQIFQSTQDTILFVRYAISDWTIHISTF